ncbi:MAG: hypothetical protein BBJ60_10345 [Desulfobacterales bacterium S7086C20]|nr:MAG: hypothetical protein BBJ60_10345 [Desulfobacterales bacterium S7086C20]
MTKEVICILCPLGCRMEAQIEEQKVTKVEGNGCKKGVKHAEREVFFPGRVLTTTIRTEIPEVPLLPVRSDKEIPKEKLIACMREIANLKMSGSVKIGEAMIRDIIGLGVDIIACRTLPFELPDSTTGI